MEYKAIALTIAGSDSGGGAGIQADLKTFQAFDCFGVSVLTSITAQNTKGVRSAQDIDPKIVSDQIDMVMQDMGCGAAKTGMLSNKDIIETVATKIKEYNIEKIVIDPVMVAASGDRLLQKQAEVTFVEELIPLAYLLTPNIHEAEMISGLKIDNIKNAKRAAQKIIERGAQNVLIKGGHLKEDRAVDIFFNGAEFKEYKAARIDSSNTHGTGCTHSSAITAGLAQGKPLADSIQIAKEYVTRAIANAPNIGKGHGPLYHKITPKPISAFLREAKDFDFWFNKNKNIFESEFLAEKEFFPDSGNSVSIGVGSGLFAERLGIEKGVEPSEDMAKLAMSRGLDVKKGTAENVPYEDNKFDTVLLSTVLSYCDDPLQALQEANRILKKDGHVVVSFLPREGSYSMLYDLARIEQKFDPDRSPENPYPLKFIKGANWMSIEKVKEMLTMTGFNELEYVQTLTKHPRYSNENIEKPGRGYKKGDYVVIRARKK
jgi:hydroxymethylpyrimidine/phosphomethylpyrimidine kinase